MDEAAFAPAPEGSPTILLVEDTLDDVLLMRRAFRKAGLAVALAVAEDGDLAIEYLQGRGRYVDRVRHPWPALVLLDLKLPRTGGIEVLTWIRGEAARASLPVVVFSSSRQPEDIERAYAAGANSYLQKPLKFDALLDLVGHLYGYWLKCNVPTAPLVQNR